MLNDRTFTVMVLLIFVVSFPAMAYDFDPNDFAIEWISYDDIGAGTFNDPQTAIGRPSIDTEYYGVKRPVVPVHSASEVYQIVRVGTGGELILKFSHKVADDINNPYGSDFIIFGNSWQRIGGEPEWSYGDPDLVTITTDVVFSEPGVVSVSQDGVNWYSYDPNLCAADTFAPTLGRVYDPDNPENPENIYKTWNLWWGQVTDPTIPLDPNITGADFLGKTVAQACQMYGRSAGGTGFDLKNLSQQDYQDLDIDPLTGRKWIQYVKIECTNPDNIITPEIDAVSDVATCGDYKHPYPDGDFNNDCKVNLLDLASLSGGPVNLTEVAEIVENWLRCSFQCE